MARKRRPIEVFSMSFLDCMSCGFGAVILFFMIINAQVKETTTVDPELMAETVRKEGADIGLAFDGDADRCILVDERGELVHGDGIMTVISRQAIAKKRWAKISTVQPRSMASRDSSWHPASARM